MGQRLVLSVQFTLAFLINTTMFHVSGSLTFHPISFPFANCKQQLHWYSTWGSAFYKCTHGTVVTASRYRYHGLSASTY